MAVPTDTSPYRHGGPHLGVLAIVYVALFNAGLALVTYFFTPPPHYPAPAAGPDSVMAFFQARTSLIRVSAFLSFGAAIALGALVAAVVSRLRFLNARTSAVDIALFAGLATAFDQGASHLLEWTLTWPGITQDRILTLALYYLSYGFGGPGFSVPMGLFVGTVSLVAGSMRLLPGWIVWPGIAIGIVGVASWLNVLAPTSFLLPVTIPLTRFPSFVWLIVAGFALPDRPGSRTG